MAVEVRAQRPREELRRRRDLLAARGPAVDVHDRELRPGRRGPSSPRSRSSPRPPSSASSRGRRPRRPRTSTAAPAAPAPRRPPARKGRRPRRGAGRRAQDLSRDEYCGDGSGGDEGLAPVFEHGLLPLSWLQLVLSSGVSYAPDLKMCAEQFWVDSTRKAAAYVRYSCALAQKNAVEQQKT